MLSHITDKLEKVHILEPVVIIDHFRRIGPGWAKIKEFH